MGKSWGGDTHPPTAGPPRAPRGRGQPRLGLAEISPVGASSQGMLLRESPREDSFFFLPYKMLRLEVKGPSLP